VTKQARGNLSGEEIAKELELPRELLGNKVRRWSTTVSFPRIVLHVVGQSPFSRRVTIPHPGVAPCSVVRSAVRWTGGRKRSDVRNGVVSCM